MIEDGIYLHNVFNIVYLLKGDKVMMRPDDDPHWESSGMDREHMQTLLDNGLIRKK